MAMVTGIIVTSALLAILEFSLREQSQITDRTQANQIGRTAMSNIVDELHSSCTGARPIQEPSTLPSGLEKTSINNLWFISSYGTENSGKPLIEEAYEHDINWTLKETDSSGNKLGTLTDYSFKSISGNSQTGWIFPTTYTKKRIISTNVIAATSGIFKYYKYNSSGQLTEILPSAELPLSTATAAENVAKVAVNFTQAPEDAEVSNGRTAAFSDSVVMRLDPTTSEELTPCE